MKFLLPVLFAALVWIWATWYKIKKILGSILFRDKLYNKLRSVETWDGNEWVSFDKPLLEYFGRDCSLNQIVGVVGEPVRVSTKNKTYIVTKKKPTLAGRYIEFWTSYKHSKVLFDDPYDEEGNNYVRYFSERGVVNFIGKVPHKMMGKSEQIVMIDELSEEKTWMPTV